MQERRYWFRRADRPGGTVFPSCWQAVALLAALPLVMALAVLALTTVSQLALLLGLPVVILTAIWLFGSIVTERLEPPRP